MGVSLFVKGSVFNSMNSRSASPSVSITCITQMKQMAKLMELKSDPPSLGLHLTASPFTAMIGCRGGKPPDSLSVE